MNLKLLFAASLFFLQNGGLGQTSHSSPPRAVLPDSEIDMPVIVDLKPLYRLTDQNVPTIFTSPNYPQQWVEADCATRYKYRFRRSPFRITTNGNRLDLAFTGFYKIIGSTRACVNGTVLSPWTPTCRCGFEEGDRKVDISFSGFFSLLPNYVLKTKFIRNEPKPLDACEVCFWGQDVTASVLKGLKAELDLTRRQMEDSFGNLNLRPYMENLWQALAATYSLPGIGYFQLRPKKFRMENIRAVNDFLTIQIGITANPLIDFKKPEEQRSPLPPLTTTAGNNGFNIFLQAALQYDSLSFVLNGLLQNKRFDISEGLIKKHIIIQSAKVAGSAEGDMKIEVDFTGSFNGSVVFTGTPSYDPSTQAIEVKELNYDLQTKNLLLKTAKWLFSNKIKSELQKYTRFSLADYYLQAQKAIEGQLNKQWVKGIKSNGSVSLLSLLNVQALPDHLLIQSNCSGSINFTISGLPLSFNH